MCFGKKASKLQIILKNCKYLSRILDAIKYTQSIQENIYDQETKDIAMEMYINEEYKNCLNDYNHIISTHSEHLEDIHRQLDKCSIFECKTAKRCNNNDRRASDEQKSDSINNNNHDHENSKAKFYSDLLDRTHFWLYHQFDVGMRIEKSVLNQKENDFTVDLDEKAQNANLDHKFAKMKIEIMQRRNKYSKKKQNAEQIDKYTMQVHKPDYMTKSGDIRDTFIDSICQQLQQEQIDTNTIASFLSFIAREQYDSDAVIADITQYDNGSNIIELFNIQPFCEFLQELSYDINRMCHFHPFVWYLFLMHS